ncbi:hypothetical protein [Halohasta litorea]|uniref:Metallo-beta-lactamase superfamily protein n=1 Tax=Halohasta litorea TaxID=869891 RepID=A0ABD6D8Q7_9EURY|nr:hypothetical protein [Halohasta litorea]
MVMYDRSRPTDPQIDRWDEGAEWIAHPDETGRRASHLLAGSDGVWLFDPLDVSGLDELIADYGELEGVAICSNYHARDADAIARRHDVSIHVPTWLTRLEGRFSSTVERCEATLGASGFELSRVSPLPGYDEAVAYRKGDGTLYVPDALGTAPFYTVGDERLACYGVVRLFPPRSLFDRFDPDRVLVGYGQGVFTDAAAALDDALAGARRRFLRALREHGSTQLRGLLAALGG